MGLLSGCSCGPWATSQAGNRAKRQNAIRATDSRVMKLEWAGSSEAVSKRDTPFPIHRHGRTVRTLLMRYLGKDGATVTVYGKHFWTQSRQRQGIREFHKTCRLRGKFVQVMHMCGVRELGFGELCAVSRFRRLSGSSITPTLSEL